MNVADNVIEYIRTQLTPASAPIGMDTNLSEGHIDSTGMLELILWIGDTFNIVIQNEDLMPENFATPRNIVEFVHLRTKNEGSAAQGSNFMAELPGD